MCASHRHLLFAAVLSRSARMASCTTGLNVRTSTSVRDSDTVPRRLTLLGTPQCSPNPIQMEVSEVMKRLLQSGADRGIFNTRVVHNFSTGAAHVAHLDSLGQQLNCCAVFRLSNCGEDHHS
ncbi:hypothetical protein C8J57DRAFT_1228197 [Mycena rebaudengoi]|nr:hypothetical protein C8J57DRAFT_1228197 [Mycena rebaudengoi]